MKKSQIFAKAHKITKAIIQSGDNYQVTFSAALRSVYAESNKVSLVDILISKGGKRWTKANMDRIYFDAEIIAAAYGLEVSYYKTGNISLAKLDGEIISNSKAGKILGNISCGKFYYDIKAEKFASIGMDSSCVECTIEYLTK